MTIPDGFPPTSGFEASSTLPIRHLTMSRAVSVILTAFRESWARSSWRSKRRASTTRCLSVYFQVDWGGRRRPL